MCEVLNLSTDVKDVTHGRNIFDASIESRCTELVWNDKKKCTMQWFKMEIKKNFQWKKRYYLEINLKVPKYMNKTLP